MKKITIILTIILSSFNLFANAFTPGNLVVVRVGDGAAALTSVSTILFIDEYSVSGAFVQSIQMPIAINGANKRLTVSGSATSEGALSLSPNGQFITLTGYDTIPGFAGVTSSTTVARVVGFLDYTGAVNTTTTTDGYSGNNIRGAVTVDGTAFWTSGPSTGSRYVLLGASTSVQITTTLTNMRVINIINGQLFVSSSSGSFLGVSALGTGIPTTSGQTVTGLFTLTGNSSYGFSMNPAGTVCYVADDRALTNGGVQKWTFNGSTWSLATTINSGITAGCRGLTVDWSGANPVIFATTSYGTIVKATDNGSPSFVTIDTCAVNTVFRGIAFAPSPAAPAPPNLVSPVNNSTGNLTSLNLVWNKSASATSYRVQVATDNSFNTLILNDSTVTDSIRNVPGLQPLTNYWWRVKAKNSGGTSSFSGVFTFRTLGVPTQIAGPFVPANGATNQPTTVNFKWGRSIDQTLAKKLNLRGVYNSQTISNYWFELVTDSVSLANLLRDTTLTDTNRTVSSLSNSTNYYWRVKAKNQIGWGSFSFWQKLTTVVAAPGAPNLVSPPNNSTGISTTPQLTWDSIVTAATYRVQIATDSLFTSPVKDTSGVLNARYNVPSGVLSNNVRYYWRAQATNIGGTGPFSVIFNFTVSPVGISNILGVPVKYQLYNNYPNPFNPNTKIRFDIPKSGITTLRVFDLLGRESALLVNSSLEAGKYEINFDAGDFASGIYFYRLESNGFTSVKKMVLIK